MGSLKWMLMIGSLFSTFSAFAEGPPIVGGATDIQSRFGRKSGRHLWWNLLLHGSPRMEKRSRCSTRALVPRPIPKGS